MHQKLLIMMITIGLLAVACGSDTTPTETVRGTGGSSTTTTTPATSDTPEGRLNAARALWAEAGIMSYRLTSQELCFCPETVWVDTVVDGRVIKHVPANEDWLRLRQGRRVAVHGAHHLLSRRIRTVNERWTLTAGTLEVQGADSETECNGAQVQGKLTGAIAESATGESIELGDIDMSNTRWGCFAG